MTTEKKLTISMTRRPPISVAPSQWGTIADARWYAGAIECQASEDGYLRVRRHADGRAIVYGQRGIGPGGMPAGYRSRYGGEILAAGADIAAAILRVAESCGLEMIAEECIADLPAEEM